MTVAWLCANLALAVAGLVMLLNDIVRRRRLGLSLRFYWQAVALLLVSVIIGTVKAVIHPDQVDLNPVRMVLTSVALVYLIISVLKVAAQSDDR